MTYIPYGRQHIDDTDVEAVVNVLRSDWLTQGQTIDRFEQAVADYCGAKYAVAVSSATAALHLACLAAGLGEGDSLWTSPNTFVASANCARYCGADVDFVDIDPKTYNLSVDLLEQKLTEAEKEGKLPKILIPVHFSGQPCEMEKIAGLAKRYGITIIEDAAHAIGAEYRGTKTGDCAFSDMTVFSFHPVKIVTTGEGGMIMTNQKALYDKLIRLRTHGITREPGLLRHSSEGAWYYEQLELGYHYRMTDIQASLGTTQMARLPEFLKRRRELAKRYDRLLADLPLELPYQLPGTDSSYHLYVVKLDPAKTKLSRREAFDLMRQAGIGVQVHYIPVHTQPYYQELGFKAGHCPNAENYYRYCLSLPMYYSLTDEQQDYVAETLQRALSALVPSE